MGQKVNPVGMRLGLNTSAGWNSNWFVNTTVFADTVMADYEARQLLQKDLAAAGISRIKIERPARNARIVVYAARPAVVIGKKGEEVEKVRKKLSKLLNVPVHLTLEEVRKPELDAKLVAESVADQLVRRVMFRRAMKRAVSSALKAGAKGVKIMLAGRLGGAEIARTEWYREGRVPLHTLRADVDYATAEAKTTYGVIGIKVWIFKGEILGKDEQQKGKAAE